MGQHESALKSVDRAIARDAKCARAHVHRGMALLALGRRRDAPAALDRAGGLDTDSLGAHRFDAMSKLSPHRDAIATHHHVKEITPGISWAHADCGLTLLALGRPEDALHAYDRAARLDPGDAMAHVGLGHALLRLGRHADAPAACGRAV